MSGHTWRELERADMDAAAAHAVEMESRAGQACTLTAEQVREAIFNGSSYASYDGAKYYADGISMQAIADELNTRAERTCKMRADGAHCMNGVEFYECRSCGEYACIPTVMGKSEPPNYCPNCGAKVVGE